MVNRITRVSAERGLSGAKGQVLVEYAVIMVAFLGVVLMLMLLLAVFTEYGWRMVSLTSMDI